MTQKKSKRIGWENKIKDRGYRLTRPRKIILKLMAGFQEPRTAENIYMAVQKEDKSIGMATVYRTLELLVKINIAAKISFGTDRSFYIISETGSRSIPNYLICKKCGRIIASNQGVDSQLQEKLIQDAETNIFKDCGIKVEGYQVFYTGYCDKCV